MINDGLVVKYSYKSNASYNERWSSDGLIENGEDDTPEYYDLYDDLTDRLCEENGEPGEEKVCCFEDDIKVESSSTMMIKKSNQFKQ